MCVPQGVPRVVCLPMCTSGCTTGWRAFLCVPQGVYNGGYASLCGYLWVCTQGYASLCVYLRVCTTVYMPPYGGIPGYICLPGCIMVYPWVYMPPCVCNRCYTRVILPGCVTGGVYQVIPPWVVTGGVYPGYTSLFQFHCWASFPSVCYSRFTVGVKGPLLAACSLFPFHCRPVVPAPRLISGMSRMLRIGDPGPIAGYPLTTRFTVGQEFRTCTVSHFRSGKRESGGYSPRDRQPRDHPFHCWTSPSGHS